jgi:epoxyqueuosine reductase QueG
LELKKEFEPVKGLSLKVLAAISGLGYYGKNTLIHNESFGSAMFLYAYETFEDMDWDELISSKDYMDFSDCKECRKCVDACPTGALDSSYKLNRVKCMRNYMLEGISVPEDIKPFMEDRLLGCDICQQACPKNQITTKTYLMPSFEELQTQDREAFIVENYIKNKDRGFKKYMNSLSMYIGKNYARSKRVLEQCEIIYDNIKK